MMTTKQTVPRDEEGRKMYPGRFWSWPEDIQNDEEYLIALWTETNTNTPTMRQISFALRLLNERVGADPEKVDWATRKGIGRAIDQMLRLPVRKGGWARPGREV